jgi:hypothetical protein
MSKDKLPPNVSSAIDEKLAEAGAAWRAGDHARSQALRLEAWALIPEPKLQWDYYPQQIARNVVTRYRDMGEFDLAKQWLDTMRAAYAPANEASDDSIGFLEGTVLFEAGEHDAAFERFDKLYRKYKNKFFQGADNKKYLDFLLSRKKK